MKANPKLSKKYVCAAVFSIFLFSSSVQASTFTYSPESKSSIEIINQNGEVEIGECAYNHIKYLAETVGTRVAGTSKDLEAANYVKARMDALGLKTSMQKFMVSWFPYSNLKTNSNGVKSVDYVFGSNIKDASGDIIDCGKGINTKSFPKGVKDNIALVERGVNSFEEKVKLAEQAGASGVIIYNNTNKEVKRPQLENWKSNIPVVLCSNEQGKSLMKDNKNAEISMMARYSQNVIGVRPAKTGVTNPEIVYVTCHYDCVKGSVGADDNASGVGMMLAMAEQLKNYDLNKEIRFVSFGAEEAGLVGSSYYVKNLSKSDKSRSIANFNFDMVGTGYEQCRNMGVVTVDGEPNVVTDAALREASNIGGDRFVTGKEDRSDHTPFYNAGIDSACFIRLTDTGETSPYYHNTTDNMQHIDKARINASGKIIFKSLVDVLQSSASKTKSIDKSQKENLDFKLPQGFFKDAEYK